MDITQKIKAANSRLKNNYCGLSLEQIGGRLWIRGIFPPKPNSGKLTHYQQRISAANANDEGVKIAERLAKKISIQLDAKTFDWNDYMENKTTSKTVGEYLDSFENDYFEKRSINNKTLTTWKVEYLDILKFLPKNEVPNTELFRKIIITKSAPNTRSRKRYVSTLSIFANFCGLDCDFRNLIGNYSQSSRVPREIPTDDQIVKQWENIPTIWKWAYGVQATYGLRNHEIFYLDWESLAPNQGIKILDGKTGYRQVWPFSPDWFELFNLGNPQLPEIRTDRTNRELGAVLTKVFKRNNIGFTPYDLRHAWAIRTIEYGLDISLSAKMMGHSLEVHSRLYHTWIQEKTFQSAYDKIFKKD